MSISWQPIDTAPKDGSHILAAFNPTVGSLQILQWHTKKSGSQWVDAYTWKKICNRPTHWMPLPPFPYIEGECPICGTDNCWEQAACVDKECGIYPDKQEPAVIWDESGFSSGAGICGTPQQAHDRLLKAGKLTTDNCPICNDPIAELVERLRDVDAYNKPLTTNRLAMEAAYALEKLQQDNVTLQKSLNWHVAEIERVCNAKKASDGVGKIIAEDVEVLREALKCALTALKDKK